MGTRPAFWDIELIKTVGTAIERRPCTAVGMVSDIAAPSGTTGTLEEGTQMPAFAAKSWWCAILRHGRWREQFRI